MGPFVVAIVLLLLSAVTLADGQSRASAPKPAPGARGQTPATAASPMSTALINSLLDLAKTGYAGSFLGLHRFDGDTTMLSINSARALIAFSQQRRALEKGGTYTRRRTCVLT